MKHGSLFSGIGGFDLAAEWMGWENIFHCEWNPFGQKILKHYWPKAESFEDITKTDFTKYANKIDILTGGFPCQPYSSAGKRLGKEDERHLWPEMLRAISEISPRFVVGENVRGLLNWNGGMVFDEVCAELENIGYQVAPIVIPAAAVNAPHGRDRIWFIASNTNRNGFDKCNSNNEINTSQRRFDALCDIESSNVDGIIAYTNLQRQEWQWKQGSIRKERQRRKKRFGELGNNEHQWEKFPSQSPICGGDDGLPTELDGITFSKWRQESIKGFGNAIVPQVAFEIFKAIEQCDNDML